MEKRILLTVNYKEKPLEIVHSFVPKGFTLATMETTSHDELVERAACADYILASGNLKIDRDVISSAKKLKMVQRLGVGLDSLDLECLRKNAIPVYVNKGVNAGSVAEHAIMFMLASLRRLPIINANTKNGIWKKQEQGVTTRELSTQTVGIIGAGSIGKRVAAILKGFGCKVLYFDVFRLAKEEEEKLGIEYRTLDELFCEADLVSLHCPLTADTQGIINKASLNKMKNGMILVNTSRGGLIDESALVDALNDGRVGMAALDVFQEEPVKNTNLISHENVICTPHIAGNSSDAFSKMMSNAFENIKSFDQGLLPEIEEFLIK